MKCDINCAWPSTLQHNDSSNTQASKYLLLQGIQFQSCVGYLVDRHCNNAIFSQKNQGRLRLRNSLIARFHLLHQKWQRLQRSIWCEFDVAFCVAVTSRHAGGVCSRNFIRLLLIPSLQLPRPRAPLSPNFPLPT